MNILIVDDNANDRRLLRYTFEHYGLSVIEAENGQEALTLAKSDPPDIIVSDALMPVMDGFQLLRALKTAPSTSGIPFFFYSASYTGQQEIDLALSLGAEKFLTKPKEPEELWEETNRILRGREARLLTTAKAADETEEQFLREYSHIVAAKLEEKVAELEKALAEREQAENEVRRLNAELDQRVCDRTTALELKSNELEESRLALVNLVEELNLKAQELEGANKTLSFEITRRQHAQDEIIRLNEDLQKQKEALEVTNKELESFSYSVSHDLRAPLGHIEGFSRLLLEEYANQLENDGTEYLLRIQKNCQHMNGLIDDMLRFSRTAKEEMHAQTVELSKIAADILNELHRAEPNRKVQVNIDNGISCTGDPNLLRAVLENLLSNAWKYTSKTGAAYIEFGVQDNGEAPVYFVRDNGAGFNMEYYGKLFEVFQRLHSKDDFEGTGVGLATVQRIIHRHGGKVWAEGKVNEGATFFFTVG